LNAPVDYIGLGPVFPTRTKETGYPVLGREGLQSLAAIANVPVIAIGGIHLENLPGLLNSGIRGLAFTSLLLDRENPEEAAAKLIQMWKTNKIAEHAKR
jgi:thiamine-phosphate pyrophosphorylase